jgi:hypothetical protein
VRQPRGVLWDTVSYGWVLRGAQVVGWTLESVAQELAGHGGAARLRGLEPFLYYIPYNIINILH